MFRTVERKLRGGFLSVMVDRHVKNNENTEIVGMDTNSFYGYSMSQPLPCKELHFGSPVSLKNLERDNAAKTG